MEIFENVELGKKFQLEKDPNLGFVFIKLATPIIFTEINKESRFWSQGDEPPIRRPKEKAVNAVDLHGKYYCFNPRVVVRLV